jgi:hypothetical protein
MKRFALRGLLEDLCPEIRDHDLDREGVPVVVDKSGTGSKRKGQRPFINRS